MKVLITGASGLMGSALRAFFAEQGLSCQSLKRLSGATEPWSWDPSTQAIRLGDDPSFDAVIHLAGESIASGRWTAAKKTRIRDSRVMGTQLLAETLAGLTRKPKVLVSASAIGYYGHREQEELHESSSVGQGFLSEVCQAWEQATEPAQAAGIRVVHARFGVVLSKRGGALAQMLTPFKLGLGGRVGPGNQFMSWIGIYDVVTILQFLISEDSLNGPINVVAPSPVTNLQFTKTLGRVLQRPTLCPMPAWAAGLVFGEMADQLLLSSTRVSPAKLIELGYEFQHSELEPALREILA